MSAVADKAVVLGCNGEAALVVHIEDEIEPYFTVNKFFLMVANHKGFDHLGHNSRDGIESALYRSRHSGLRIVINQLPSPIVSISIVVPTLASSDEGEPHCLEHLVFRGSRQYPPGYLDSAAQHFVSDGTNAYTATDRTVYLVSTAGQDGACRMIPIFLDHIYYPRLAKEDFDTEVFHISEDLENSGVVYSEMETAYATPPDIMFDAFKKACYPVDCPYRYETGGHPSCIPNLTLEKVKRFHQTFYTPAQTTLFVQGNCDKQRVLDAVAEFEVTLDESHLSRKDETRVSVQRPQLLPSKRTITFFNHHEDDGDCQVGLMYEGADYNNIEERTALSMLGIYLTEGSSAPFVQLIVENEVEEYAADVMLEEIDFRWGAMAFMFDGCYMKNVKDIKGKVSDIMEALASDSDEAETRFDLARMHTLIRKKIWEDRAALESDPGTHVEPLVSSWAVNAPGDDVNLGVRIFSDKILEALMSQPVQFWQDLIQRRFVASDPQEVIALPSQLKKIEKVVMNKRLLTLPGRTALSKAQIKAEEEKRVALLHAYLNEHPLAAIDSSKLSMCLGEVYTSKADWRHSQSLSDLSNAYLFVDLKCMDKGTMETIRFNSEFVNLSFLVPWPEHLTSQALMDLCKSRIKNVPSLTIDIQQFLESLMEMDYEIVSKQRQEAIKEELEEYTKASSIGESPAEDLSSSHSKLRQQPPTADSKDESSNSVSSEGSAENGIDFELSYALRFVMEHFKSGKLLSLLAKTIFNTDIQITRNMAKRLGFQYDRDDVTERGLVNIDHTLVNEKLNEWAVEYTCHQGLGSSAVFDHVMLIDWKVKKEFFGESLLLLRVVIEKMVINEERLVCLLRKELSNINTDLRSGDGVISGLTWLDRYQFQSSLTGCNRLIRNIVSRVALKYPEIFCHILSKLHADLCNLLTSQSVWLAINADADAFFNASSKQPCWASFRANFPEYFKGGLVESPPPPSVTPLWKGRRPNVYQELLLHNVQSDILETGYVLISVDLPETVFSEDLRNKDDFSVWYAVDVAVTAEFLQLTEGPIFKTVRDSGSCYVPRFQMSLDQKTMALSLDDCVKPIEALQVALRSLSEVLDCARRLRKGRTEDLPVISLELFEQAKAATVHSYINELETPVCAADACLDSWMRQLPLYLELQLLPKIQNVSFERFLEVLELMLDHFLQKMPRCAQVVWHYPKSQGFQVQECINSLHPSAKQNPLSFYASIADVLLTRTDCVNKPHLAAALVKTLQAPLHELNDLCDSDDEDSEDCSSSMSEDGLAY
eukprot:Blabericola_migrator_1__6905@NODE_349_length_9523_cov_128_512902_g280_i0_p1_GENE_NODE_349_length_9523_cov_128_512902_g280_i0NODE_349_length_9523_cov_128_512902_g280_i0_p1_ORF_typecomplete_len1277_score247_97Peptidase_M16/PF00675_20/2_5e16Peptidase_M16/PF00675_20/1_3e04Peptidase_M16_C/PF05193_21/6_8e13Peptidase_M16_C/PF05193_21/1_7e03_NODE_349_length_9523_cov_128_512902_g280_i035277357